MSGGKDRGVGPRERRDCPSTSSMDDWYLEVCKRNVNRLSVIDGKQRERSGSLKPTVTFVTGDVRETPAGSFSKPQPSRHPPARKTSSSPVTNADVSSIQSHSNTMKRMATDPRILTGHKGAPTLTQWYDHEITGVSSDDYSSFGFFSETSSPESVQNQSQLNASYVANGHQVSPEQVIRERLLMKINRTNEQLIAEQNAKQLSVNEYLRISSSISPMDRAQAQRVKAAFERRNQKSTAVVAQLQRKLESYKQRLNEVEESSRRLSSGSIGMTLAVPSQWPAFDLLKGIKDSVSTNLRSGISGFSGTIVTKPRVLAHMIRNRFGSADNIASMREMDDDEALQQPNSVSRVRIGSTLPASFRCYSDEDLSKLGISSPSSIALSPVLAASSPLRAMSPQDGTQRHLNAHDNTTDNESTDFTMVAVLEGIKNHRRMFRKQMDEVIELKCHLAASQKKWREEIELERTRSERLVDQLNDLSDVHQDELIAVKQELSMFEEKLAYQLDERMRDMHEMIDNCHNRLAKLEAVQQRTTAEGVDNSHVRTYIVKLINIALSFLALLLIVISFVVNLLHPFLSTRSHLIVTSSCIAIAVVVWYSWNVLTNTRQPL